MNKRKIKAEIRAISGDFHSCSICGYSCDGAELVEVVGEIPEAKPRYRNGVGYVFPALEFRVCSMCLRRADEDGVKGLISWAITVSEWRLSKLRRLRGRLELPSWAEYDEYRKSVQGENHPIQKELKVRR